MLTPKVFTVSQINSRINDLIASDPEMQMVFVEGELSNVNINSKSGHVYFSVKDKQSVIRAVMFSFSFRNLKFRPEDGMKVIMRAQVTVYQPYGQYQLRVEDMQPDGVGVLAMRLEQLKKKLSAEGLFDKEHKKPIPSIPNTVGVITSPTGAAIRDIIDIIGRRFPAVTIVIAPVLVQGDGAPAQLIDAVKRFSDNKAADVLIIGRGGGSAEDLWAFNDEGLARAIYDCRIPIISAVGHETDFTICDFVSDMRAPTPSAAAELAVPNMADLRRRIDMLSIKCRNVVCNRFDSAVRQFEKNERLVEAYSPDKYYERRLDHITVALKRASFAVDNHIAAKASLAQQLNAKVESLNPLSVLDRGFTYIMNNEKIAASVNDVKSGDTVDIVFKDGKAKAEIL